MKQTCTLFVAFAAWFVFVSSGIAQRPQLDVSPLGTNLSGNREWLVTVTPGFVPTPLAVELAFSVIGSQLVNIDVNEAIWDTPNPGNNPYTGTVTNGLWIAPTNLNAFGAFGSAELTNTNPVELFRIETLGTGVTTLNWGEMASPNPAKGDIIAAMNGSFINYTGSLTVPSTTLTTTTAANPLEGTTPNQGWWSNTRTTSTLNSSYFVGNLEGDHRDFFTFSLPNGIGQVSGATLKMKRGGISATNEESEVFGLFDVTTDPLVLNHNVGPDFTIYNDLGSGQSYGQFQVDGAGDADSFFSFPLNSAAIAAINAHLGQYFSIGGRLISDDGADYLFGSAGPPAILELQLAVPETSTPAIAMLGIFAFAIRCRLTRKLLIASQPNCA